MHIWKAEVIVALRWRARQVRSCCTTVLSAGEARALAHAAAHLEGQLPVLDLLHVAADRGVRDDVLAQVQLVQHRRLPGIVQPCDAVQNSAFRCADVENYAMYASLLLQMCK